MTDNVEECLTKTSTIDMIMSNDIFKSIFKFHKLNLFTAYDNKRWDRNGSLYNLDLSISLSSNIFGSITFQLICNLLFTLEYLLVSSFDDKKFHNIEFFPGTFKIMIWVRPVPVDVHHFCWTS